nr:MAG TPA: hypothetical protein [Caudoviricetes sp.]
MGREGVCNCTFSSKESLRGKHGPDFRKKLTPPTPQKTPLTMKSASGALSVNARATGRSSHLTATPTLESRPSIPSQNPGASGKRRRPLPGSLCRLQSRTATTS